MYLSVLWNNLGHTTFLPWVCTLLHCETARDTQPFYLGYAPHYTVKQPRTRNLSTLGMHPTTLWNSQGHATFLPLICTPLHCETGRDTQPLIIMYPTLLWNSQCPPPPVFLFLLCDTYPAKPGNSQGHTSFVFLWVLLHQGFNQTCCWCHHSLKPLSPSVSLFPYTLKTRPATDLCKETIKAPDQMKIFSGMLTSFQLILPFTSISIWSSKQYHLLSHSTQNHWITWVLVQFDLSVFDQCIMNCHDYCHLELWNRLFRPEWLSTYNSDHKQQKTTTRASTGHVEHRWLTMCWSLRRWMMRDVHSPMGITSGEARRRRRRVKAALCLTASMVSL